MTQTPSQYLDLDVWWLAANVQTQLTQESELSTSGYPNQIRTSTCANGLPQV
jgi:hypothetical protein